MPLSGKAVDELQNALISAFSADELTRLVRIHLDENLDAIAGDDNLSQTVFELITWADRQGRLDELIRGAANVNPRSDELRTWIETHSAQIAAGDLPQTALHAPQTPIAIEWCHVPAGPFYMGSTNQQIEAAYQDVVKINDNVQREWFEYEEPQHLLFVDDYLIAQTPVTNAQFAQFVSATGYITSAEKSGKAFGMFDDEWQWVEGMNWQHPAGPSSVAKMDHPIVSMSWHDAIAFCQWAGVQLPSEAQWEKAARGTDGRIYPWGNDLPTNKHCNFNMTVGTTTAVGNYPAGVSPYGCFDMAGNVLEWTASQLRSYPYNSHDGREDITADAFPVVRGGSFHYNWSYARCAYRLPLYDFDLDDALFDVGMRVVCTYPDGNP